MVKRLNDYKSLTNFIKNNNCFQISGNRLFCNICNEPKEYNPRQGVRALKRHLTTKKHLEGVERKFSQTRLDVLKSGNENEDFHKNLVNAFITANIPLNKLSNFTLKSFLEKISGFKIKTPATYGGSILNSLYQLRKNKVKEFFKDCESLYVVFDETTDFCGGIF